MLWRGLTGASDKALCFVTDGGRDVVTLSRGLYVRSTQASAASVYCYLCNPWQCRMRGQYRGITAVPGHKAIIKLKKNNCIQWTKEGLRASLFQNQPGLGHQELCWALPGSVQRHLVVKRAATS